MGRMKRRGQRKQRGQRGVEEGRFQEGKEKISRRKGIISGREEEDSRGEGKIFFGEGGKFQGEEGEDFREEGGRFQGGERGDFGGI